MRPLRGSFWVFVLYDVAEEIDLDKLCDLVGAKPVPQQPSFKHPTPEYVRFERPPAIEYPRALTLESGEQFEVRIKYFDYGVVSVELKLEFEADWEELVRLSNRWILAPELEARTAELLRPRMERAAAALTQAYSARLSEDYYIIHLREAVDEDGQPLTAPVMLAKRGGEIAQIVRGESQPLAESERHEVLQSSLSYYPTDLLVIGWVAALVYDTQSGAEPTIQLLEYANTQLLEFRHYDDVLTRVLEKVYKTLEQRWKFSRRWKMAGEAERLNTLRLDVPELTERTDNAIKFLSDMFYARAYKIAAARVGVTDYRNLVEEKLRTAGDLYRVHDQRISSGAGIRAGSDGGGDSGDRAGAPVSRRLVERRAPTPLRSRLGNTLSVPSRTVRESVPFALKFSPKLADYFSVGDLYLQSRLDFLRNTQNPDGGWGYFPGKHSWLEPTTYATLALHGTPGADVPLNRPGTWFAPGKQPKEATGPAARYRVERGSLRMW